MKTVEQINESLNDLRSESIKRRERGSIDPKKLRKIVKELNMLEYCKKAIESGLTELQATAQINDLNKSIKLIEDRLPEIIGDGSKQRRAQIKSMYNYSDKKNQVKFLQFCLA